MSTRITALLMTVALAFAPTISNWVTHTPVNNGLDSIDIKKGIIACAARKFGYPNLQEPNTALLLARVVAHETFHKIGIKHACVRKDYAGTTPQIVLGNMGGDQYGLDPPNNAVGLYLTNVQRNGFVADPQNPPLGVLPRSLTIASSTVATSTGIGFSNHLDNKVEVDQALRRNPGALGAGSFDTLYRYSYDPAPALNPDGTPQLPLFVKLQEGFIMDWTAKWTVVNWQFHPLDVRDVCMKSTCTIQIPDTIGGRDRCGE